MDLQAQLQRQFSPKKKKLVDFIIDFKTVICHFQWRESSDQRPGTKAYHNFPVCEF